MTVLARFPARPSTSVARSSFWLQQALPADPVSSRPPLTGDVDADVCIVGAGFTGLWTALEVKRLAPSARVVLLEADVCGSGASGRNGGFVMTWWSKFLSLSKLCGPEAALKLAMRAERAVDEIGTFCQQHGIDADFRQGGWLWTATSRAQIDAWQETVVALAAVGATPFEDLSSSEVAIRAGSPIHLAGILDPKAAIVQPAMLVRGMACVADRAGVEIYEQSPVVEIRQEAVAHVQTAGGTVRARRVALTLNGWAAAIAELRRALVVVSSDMIATEPVPQRLRDIGWTADLAVSDSRRLVNYYRQSTDHRVIFGKGGGSLAMGGRVGPRFDGVSARAAEVRASFERAYPALWDVPTAMTWRGPIDYSVTALPFVAPLHDAPNVLVAAGFSGNGVGPSYLVGQVLASLAVGEADPDWPKQLTRMPGSRMPPEPFRHGGGLLVRAALTRKEKVEDLGRKPSALIRAVADLDPTAFVDRGNGVADSGSFRRLRSSWIQ
ncbi:MAG: FAD-binding oxidoreductase [Actinomycetota bacterium]|nr:FAD-binding oxidoreductase [Actinomycetota bacterium]